MIQKEAIKKLPLNYRDDTGNYFLMFSFLMISL
ncbi:MAG: hypothetical protein FD166_3413 [Bacteroidetes bacterium]|nr:MAG: hypothetical protein FD166_3413 [Bacteroidota bacterium]